MHSAVEYATKIAVVYPPGQWCTVISMACRSKPYLIVLLQHGDVIDYKDISRQIATT